LEERGKRKERKKRERGKREEKEARSRGAENVNYKYLVVGILMVFLKDLRH
jgi:hypothetical protein